MSLRLQPFIMHGKFQTMQQVLNDYEKHCKKRIMSQARTVIGALFSKTKEIVNEKINNDESRSAEMQVIYAKRLLFGDLAGIEWSK